MFVVDPMHLVVYTADVKNINLQIKNIKIIKNTFFTFRKNSKNMHKNIKLQYPQAPSIRIK